MLAFDYRMSVERPANENGQPPTPAQWISRGEWSEHMSPYCSGFSEEAISSGG